MTATPPQVRSAAADAAAGASALAIDAHSPQAPASTAVAQVHAACLRLDASRARLRLALHGPPAPARGEAPAATWWTGLLALPAVRVLRDAVQGWWSQHPWHAAGNAAATAVNAALQPVARRHPWALVAAAVLAGGLVAASRPWRWRAQMATGAAGRLPRMLNEVLATLPIASWLVLLAALAQAVAPAAPSAASPTDPAPGPAPDPTPAPSPAEP